MLEFMDNFSLYGTDTSLMTQGIYAEQTGVFLVADPDGISTGRVLRIQSNGFNGQTSFRRVISTGAKATVGTAFRLWLSSLPGNNDMKTHHVSVRNSANDEIAFLAVLSTGVIRVNIANNISYDTLVPVLTANAWTHIEFKYVHSGTNLVSFEVRVEGVTVLSRTNIAGADQDVAQIAQSRTNISGDGQNFIKDFVIWTSGGAYNTDFLGSVIVYSLIPVSDVALNWTPSTGTNGFSILDNSPPVDTQYIAAANPPPAAYVCEVSNLPLDVTSIKGLMAFVRASKTDGGDGSLQTSALSGAAAATGANRPITVAQTWWSDIFEQDPNTSAAWTPGAVDAVRLRINRTL